MKVESFVGYPTHLLCILTRLVLSINQSINQRFPPFFLIILFDAFQVLLLLSTACCCCMYIVPSCHNRIKPPRFLDLFLLFIVLLFHLLLNALLFARVSFGSMILLYYKHIFMLILLLYTFQPPGFFFLSHDV